MLPSILAREVIRGLQAYVETGFETPTPRFRGAFRELVETPGRFLKGPYLSLGLPFRRAEGGGPWFDTIDTGFPPYQHQAQAWERLRSDGLARSTLVATGTGSGKTECFLYPLLDHCARHGEPGVKAIVIYPMNALASDQARRFAETVHAQEALCGRVRVGLFVGGLEETPATTMGPRQVITDKDRLREEPPDILLTNYKMLDFLLARPRDRALWRFNTPDTLRYLVVDELHSFDGAQGTDLACLIRRLKARLLKERGDDLICVGTSATLGSEEDGEALRDYAGRIFQSPFDEGAIIGETRLSAGEFLDAPIQYVFNAPEDLGHRLDPEAYAGARAYVAAQYALFFPGEKAARPEDPDWCKKLGRDLKQHLLFNNLLRLLVRQPADLDEVCEAFAETLPKGAARAHARELLDALCALVAVARSADGREFVQLRLQLWTRELRRMVAPVKPPLESGRRLTFADDLKGDEGGVYLPLVQCNQCHATAWLTSKPDASEHVEQNLKRIYSAFFRQQPEARVLLPLEKGEKAPVSKGEVKFLCGVCGHLQAHDEGCLACGEEALQRVFEPNLVVQRRAQGNPRLVSERNCPVCGQKDALLVFGARATSLSSVAVHHTYASHFNDDKKLIAFSDNVQDAAHRAGFFSARTWLNNLRMAMSRALPEEGMSLRAFALHLPRYWRDPRLNPHAMSPETFVTEFIAPNMVWFPDYVALEETGQLPEGSALVRDIERRLGWEVIAEFGFRSLVGRSLERTGVAVAGPDREGVEQVVEGLLPALREELGLRHVDARLCRWFVLGVLWHMKQRGAIGHPELVGYVAQGAQGYALHRIAWMPDFHRQSILPRLPIEGAETAGFEALGADRGWYARWVGKTIGGGDALLQPGIHVEAYRLLFQVLRQQGLVEHFEFKGRKAWALAPGRLWLSTEVSSLSTPDERDRIFVPAEWAEAFEDMPSLTLNDPGRYRRGQRPRSWLETIYRHGDIRRVIAREHTGLLDRKTREELERRFTHSDDPWDPNLLSATPTLEMGIDIGALSTLLLCSVPPSQANYLQRVGRAGRRDGNAFSLTLAAGAPHDLYFWADPMQMMAGRVEPPGVFLNASAVIARQLTAYCLDRWVESGIPEEAIPRTLKRVLDHVEREETDRFPYDFIDFVEERALDLFDGFVALFGDELSQRTRDYLKDFIQGKGEVEGLAVRLVKRLSDLVEERRRFRGQIDQLKRHIKKLEKGPQDEAVLAEREEAARERAAFQAMLRGLNGRPALNFLTDEGVLPNYAFPEEGVTLRSVIYRRRRRRAEDDEGRVYENLVFEYQRPGAMGISELVPNNRFYAGGRKVTISRVDLKLSKLERWRFCPECSYARMERSDQAPEPACPRCGNPLWSDVGQVGTMVRLRQVMAKSSDRDSRIGDDSDERDNQFYNRQMLVDVPATGIEKAYAIEDAELPFGFEFIRDVAFREVNFGEFGPGPEKSINGETFARQGFSLCRHCGSVRSRRKDRQQHAFDCPARKKDPADEAHFIDCTYLYREFRSEAVRILLPFALGPHEDRALNSFVAGLQLGLKLKFGGRVDHLQVTTYSEPDQETGGRRHYLVLYDSVPGGTGYLQDLLESPESLLDVLRRSLERLRSCPCNQDPERDGCYRCLYAYRNSYGMETTSRDTAAELFGQILERAKALKPVDTLSRVAVNPLLGGELERFFIIALRQMARNRPDLKLRQQVVNGKPGYFLEVGDRYYLLEPQALTGPDQGVSLASRPDFLIRSASVEQGAAFKPVALFLDGFRYHNERVDDDSAKRWALVQSGRYRVWSLTWDDVAQFLGDRPGSEDGGLFTRGLHAEKRALQDRLCQRLGVDKTFYRRVFLLQPLEQLLAFLADPEEARWQALVFIRSMGWFDNKQMRDPAFVAQVDGWLREHGPGVLAEWLDALGDMACAHTEDGAHSLLALKCALGLNALKGEPDPKGLVCGLWLDDRVPDGEAFKRNWQLFLKTYNLLQFLPHSAMTTARGLEAGAYEGIGQVSNEGAQVPSWVEEAVEALQPALARWAAMGLPAPEVGMELEGEGEVVLEAELVWTEPRIVGLYGAQWEEREAFERQGWKVIRLDDDGQWIEQHPLRMKEAIDA